MDFGSPFALLCLLVIITVTQGSATWTGVLSGGSAVFSLGIQSLQDFSSMSKNDGRCITTVLNDTLLAKCGSSASRCLNLENGSLVLRSVEKEDEGKYEFVFQNTTRSFTLEVFEPTIGIHCFPDGTAELFCNVTNDKNVSFRWLLNGTDPSVPGACVKDGGKKVHLDRTVPGEFVCLVTHGTGAMKTRPIELSCSYGDLLQYPWFIYILAGCAAGVLILVVALPAAICCCMKRKHKFIPVPSEEEKDDGLTMSVVSSEGMKSPPNGDRVEAQAAQADRPPKPDAAQTSQGVEPQPLAEENVPVQIEAEEIPGPEVVVDMESQEDASDCFPDPTDE